MRRLRINIISTETDLKLFTNRKYHNKVYRALKKVGERYELTENHMIACYDNFIKVYTPKKELMLIQKI